MAKVELTGCTPDPLMGYLKSLGVLRIVAKQFDDRTRAAWRNGVFVLDGPKLSPESLLTFFATAYSPSPIAAPWAGGSGFFGKDNRSAVDALAASTLERTGSYRTVIEGIRQILADEKVSDKPADEVKDNLLRRYRREMPDDFVEWMDAALVIQCDGQSFPPLLGTGGNDGRLDFTQNFMQRVVGLGLHADGPDAADQSLLRQALFGEPTSGLSTAAVGQFAPGRAGGPNATQGFIGSSLDNPWDFILMIEGTLVLAGSVTRRMGVGQRDKAAFPFTVRANPVGFDSPSESEAADARGEIWLPLWERFTSLSEIRTIFAEGRADVSGRQSKDGVDFARAIAGLGIDRGLKSFVRFGFLKRSGKAFLAPALGQFDVPTGRSDVNLLADIDQWLTSLRYASREDTAPARFASAVRRIDSSIFNYCKYGTAALFGEIIRALGNAERELANGEKFRSNDRRTIRPLSGLRAEWIGAADDQSCEFELALSLARAADPIKGRVGTLRGNLEPIAETKHSVIWAERDPGVVWRGGSVADNLAAVLRRRLIDATRVGGGRSPVANAKTSAGLMAVSAFLAGDLDDNKLEELLWGLFAVDQQADERRGRAGDKDAQIPRCYALLKQLFVAHPLIRGNDKVEVRTEPEILTLLAREDVGSACKVAMRRLRASGFEPLPHRQTGRANRDDAWADASAGIDAGRLAAALLFPIREAAAADLLRRITREAKPDANKSQIDDITTEGAIKA